MAIASIPASGTQGRPAASPGSQGLGAGTADWVGRIQRRSRETYLAAQGAHQAIAAQGEDLSAAFISQEMLDYLAEPGPMATPELDQALRALSELIPLIPGERHKSLLRLEKVDEGAEVEVLLDATTGLVYKFLFASPNMGRVGDGFMPGEIYDSGRPETGPTYLTEFLGRIALNNEQGGQVLAEVVGITEDGRLVVAQRYIEGLVPTDYRSFGMDLRTALKGEEDQLRFIAEVERRRAALLRQLGLVTIDRDTAVGWANGTPVLVDDLHDRNLMARDGEPFIIDAATRELTKDEAELPRIKRALEQARA